VRAAIVTLLCGCLLAMACGKYGPPVRAGEDPEQEAEPAFGIPLPAATPEPAPEDEP
jgi:hypothetical protein